MFLFFLVDPTTPPLVFCHSPVLPQSLCLWKTSSRFAFTLPSYPLPLGIPGLARGFNSCFAPSELLKNFAGPSLSFHLSSTAPCVILVYIPLFAFFHSVELCTQHGYCSTYPQTSESSLRSIWGRAPLSFLLTPPTRFFHSPFGDIPPRTKAYFPPPVLLGPLVFPSYFPHLSEGYLEYNSGL